MGIEKHQSKYSEYKYFMTVFVAVNLKVEKIISLRIILFSKYCSTMTLCSSLLSEHLETNLSQC